MDAIKVILERTPPELAADIIKDGVYVYRWNMHRLTILKSLSKMKLILMSILLNIHAESVVRGLMGVVY